jgi:hypothetical protein
MTDIPRIENRQEMVAGHKVELKMLRTTVRVYVELFIDEKFFESVTIPIEFADEFDQADRPVARFATLLLKNLVFQKEQEKSAAALRRQLEEWGFKE